jgi:hypothetical protein
MLTLGEGQAEGGAMLPIRLRLEVGPGLQDGLQQRLVYPIPPTLTTIGQLVQQVGPSMRHISVSAEQPSLTNCSGYALTGHPGPPPAHCIWC